MSQAQEHDRLDELLAQAGWLERLARRLVLDPGEADEVVQETWVAALSGRPRESSLRGWLARIARNVVLQRGRAESARRARERSVARAESSDAESDALERAQAQRQLLDAVLALDEPHRSALILRYFDHLELAEIARRLGVPEPTVRTRLSRAVAGLRARFQRKDGKDWARALLPLAAPHWIVGGTLVTATWKIAGGVALVAALAWLAWPSRAGLEPPKRAQFADAPAAQPLSAPPLEQPAAAAPRAPVEAAAPARPAVASDRAALDVHVRWGDDGSDAGDVELNLWLGGAPDPFTDRRTARTDAQGHVSFEDLAPGYVAIGTDRSDGEARTLAAGAREAVELSIPDGIELRGRVVDAEKRPVAGARIWLSQYFNYDTGTDVARSGAAGEFRVRDVGPARYAGARDDRGGPSALLYLPKANPGQELEIELVLPGEARDVDGVVRDESGRPIAGAELRAQVQPTMDRDETGRFEQHSFAPELVRTDEHGRFLLRGLSRHPGRLVVRAAGFAPLERALAADAPGGLELVLPREAAVHGLVRDASGAPLAGVFFGHGEYGGATSSQTRSRADGSYRLVGLPAGQVDVRVKADEKGETKQQFALHAGDDVEWQVQLVARSGVAGRVLDAAGKPVVGFMVGAISPTNPGLFLRNTKTDASGHFELADWPPEASAVEVREPGAWVGLPTALVEPVRAGGAELEIRLAADALRTASVAGRLVGEDGRPFAAGELVCWADAIGQGTNAASDAEGRFRFGPLKPGSYTVQLTVKGFAQSRHTGIVLAADETRELGDLRLEPPAALHVMLRLPAGLELGEWPGYVTIDGPEGTQQTSIDLKGGEGKLGGLEAGRYRLRLSSDHLRAPTTEIVLRARETAEVELVCEPGTRRTMKLTLPAGSDERRIEVRVSDAAGNLVYEEVLDVRGRQPLLCFVPGLALGRYTIEARTPGGLSGSSTFEVLAFETSSGELELR